jgi:curved DNA-binding protein
MIKNLYAVLGVEQGAANEDIKKAYRTLAKKYHPDFNKNVNAEKKMAEINAAYEILGNLEKRSQYDELLQKEMDNLLERIYRENKDKNEYVSQQNNPIIKLFKITIGISLIIIAICLEIAWLGLCFGSVLIGIALLIFAPKILILPLLFISSIGLAFILS